MPSVARPVSTSLFAAPRPPPPRLKDLGLDMLAGLVVQQDDLAAGRLGTRRTEAQEQWMAGHHEESVTEHLLAERPRGRGNLRDHSGKTDADVLQLDSIKLSGPGQGSRRAGEKEGCTSPSHHVLLARSVSVSSCHTSPLVVDALRVGSGLLDSVGLKGYRGDIYTPAAAGTPQHLQVALDSATRVSRSTAASTPASARPLAAALLRHPPSAPGPSVSAGPPLLLPVPPLGPRVGNIGTGLKRGNEERKR